MRSSRAETSSSGLSLSFLSSLGAKAVNPAAQPTPAATKKCLRLLSMNTAPLLRVRLAMLLTNGLERLIVIFENLGDQLLQFATGLFEDALARGCGLVIFAPPPLHHFRMLAQITQAFEQTQSRIESAGTETVAVANQLLGDFGAVDWFLRRMIENVQANEAREKVACEGIVNHGRCSQYRILITYSDALGKASSFPSSSYRLERIYPLFGEGGRRWVPWFAAAKPRSSCAGPKCAAAMCVIPLSSRTLCRGWTGCTAARPRRDRHA